MAMFGFIGTGNMGGALVSAVCKKIDPKEVLISDHNAEKVSALAEKTGAVISDNVTIAKEAKYIMFGVKPQMLVGMIDEIRDILKERKHGFVIVSMATSFSVSHLEYVLDWVHPIIRIMPNTPVSVGEGMILYTVNDAVAEADIAEFCDAFSAAGKLDAMDEEDFNVAGIISGCGPAFMFMFIKAMEEVGKELRLTPEKARLYAEQTMLGAAKLALESGMDPDILKKNVCSPGGTTIEGVKSLEANELNRIVRDALIASFVRTKELARELL